ncbi:MAG: hypothetical protein ABR508_12190 [Candidatus Baltobacteraceae bacterium]
MRSRVLLIVMFLAATLICSYDVFFALHGRVLSWALAALMAAVALMCLRKLVRQDYSNSLW